METKENNDKKPKFFGKRVKNNPYLPVIGSDEIFSSAVRAKKKDEEYDYKEDDGINMSEPFEETVNKERSKSELPNADR